MAISAEVKLRFLVITLQLGHECANGTETVEWYDGKENERMIPQSKQTEVKCKKGEFKATLILIIET